MAEAHAGEKHERDVNEANAKEDAGLPKKAKKDELEKQAIATEPAPWVSSDAVVSASQYIADYLKSTPALSIMKEKGEVFVVNSGQHAAQAQSLMAKENLLSCPVYDKELAAHIGFVDYLDLTSLIVDAMHKALQEEFPDTKSVGLLEKEQHQKLISKAKSTFNNKTLFDISDLSKLDPFHPVPKSANLYQAIEVFAKTGVHRVPIQNDEQKIEAILSQSAVIDFLFTNLDKFPTKSKTPLSSIVRNRTVHSVKESDVAFEAFESMIEHKVSAVGVVDDENKLTGVISSTDLRLISPHAHSLSILLHTAKDFFEHAREKNKWAVLPVVTTTRDETLGIVIEKMQDNFVHRVFVVDDEHKPISVISMKDVLLQFLEERK